LSTMPPGLTPLGNGMKAGAGGTFTTLLRGTPPVKTGAGEKLPGAGATPVLTGRRGAAATPPPPTITGAGVGVNTDAGAYAGAGAYTGADACMDAGSGASAGAGLSTGASVGTASESSMLPESNVSESATPVSKSRCARACGARIAMMASASAASKRPRCILRYTGKRRVTMSQVPTSSV
jgi:hypothetical protein